MLSSEKVHTSAQRSPFAQLPFQSFSIEAARSHPFSHYEIIFLENYVVYKHRSCGWVKMQLSGKVLTTQRLDCISLLIQKSFFLRQQLFTLLAPIWVWSSTVNPSGLLAVWRFLKKYWKKLQHVLPFGHFPKNKKSFSCSCVDNFSNVICVFFCKTVSGKKNRIYLVVSTGACPHTTVCPYIRLELSRYQRSGARRTFVQ